MARRHPLPRWAESANWGFGEPRFIFYPPLSWIMGAALGLVLPWRMVPEKFIWLALVLAGISMWYFAREWLSRREAILAALVYAVNPYHLVIVYLRSDFAELSLALYSLLCCTGRYACCAKAGAAGLGSRCLSPRSGCRMLRPACWRPTLSP